MLPVLDYGGLSTDEAALAADVLDEWRALASAERNDRLQVAPTRQVPPLLKLLATTPRVPGHSTTGPSTGGNTVSSKRPG